MDFVELKLLFSFLLTACLTAPCQAEILLPSLFADHMVLQREQTVPIWGWGDPGGEITVSFAGTSIKATVRDDGAWRVDFPELDASPAPRDIRLSDSSGTVTTIRNVLVGDVWLCTGPSNIFWPVKRCDNAKEEIAIANYPNIRFFTVEKNAVDTPQKDCKGKWIVCSPKTVGGVSGVGYFFARRLHNEVEVPLGVLQSFWGGSRIEAWTSREGLEAEPGLRPILRSWEEAFAEYDSTKEKIRANYEQSLEEWKSLAASANAEGKKEPPRPPKPPNPHEDRHRPACLFNGMIAPLIPYGLTGIISYQGLGNLYWADYGRFLYPAMIRDWRSRWGREDLPFGMAQPAPYPCDRWAKKNSDAYSLQREAQLLVLDEIANTGLAPTTDLGDLEVLHFTNKQDVGYRLANWALAAVYDRDIPWMGPVYRSMTREGDKIRIHFNHTEGKLSTRDGRPPTHFTIAGDDEVFYPAHATIEGDTVVVHSEKVPDPVAVRFAWSDIAIPNLVNDAGLPASLFRTDIPSLDSLLHLD